MVSVLTAVAFRLAYFSIKALQVVDGTYCFIAPETLIPLSIGLILGVFLRIFDNRKLLVQKQ